jgi:hypothetical protein
MLDHEDADLSAWQLEFARLFAYPAKAVDLTEPLHWWQVLTGRPANLEYRQSPYSGMCADTVNGAKLSMRIDSRSILWEFNSLATAGDIPTIGPFREKIDWLLEFFTPWLATSCPPIRRLAFNCKLLQAAATQRDAFRILAAHLPMVKLEPNPNDFTLQINRRTSSAVVEGLPINRLSTWAKMNIVFSVEPGKPFEWPEKCYSALELDINTAPEKMEVLPGKFLPALLRELTEHAVKIAQRGETPDEHRNSAK